MGMHEPVAAEAATAVLDLYDRALPEVHGYLLSRCRDSQLAEDLAGDTFLAAVSAVRRDAAPDLTVAWLITVAATSWSTTGAAGSGRSASSASSTTPATTSPTTGGRLHR